MNPPKLADLMAQVHAAASSGRFLDTRHAGERQHERGILRREIVFVLLHGYHEKAKDVFKASFGSWCYAIRGKTPDGRDLRIVVAFDEDGMLVITAIELDR